MGDKKYIRFIDSSYNTLFYIPDGGSIKVHSAWNNKNQIFKCKHLDPYHVEISGSCYHICQFAEMMERNGSTYEPVTEIGDLDFYQKKYFDRKNIGSDGKPIPYYCLLDQIANKGTGSEVGTEYSFCLAPSSPEKAFCSFHWKSEPFQSEKHFGESIEAVCDDPAICHRIDCIVTAIKEVQQMKPGLDTVIKECAALVQEGTLKTPTIPAQQR